MEGNTRGTKAVFCSWLLSAKRLTYTKYAKLPTTTKLDIQKEYQKKG